MTHGGIGGREAAGVAHLGPDRHRGDRADAKVGGSQRPAARLAAGAGGPARRAAGPGSPLSRSSCRRPTSTAWRPAGDSSAAVRRAWPAALVSEAMTGTPWWYRVAWTRCSHAVRSSSKSLYSRTLALASSTCTGGIHDSGRSPLISSSRRWRASDRSVLARRLRPPLAAVSAGSARWAPMPARSSSSTTYRQPVQPSTAKATSPCPWNRARKHRRWLRSAGTTRPRSTWPVTTSRSS